MCSLLFSLFFSRVFFCFFLCRAAGGSQDPDTVFEQCVCVFRNSFVVRLDLFSFSSFCYVGPPEASHDPDTLCFKNKCFSQCRAAGCKPGPGHTAFNKISVFQSVGPQEANLDPDTLLSTKHVSLFGFVCFRVLFCMCSFCRILLFLLYVGPPEASQEPNTLLLVRGRSVGSCLFSSSPWEAVELH